MHSWTDVVPVSLLDPSGLEMQVSRTPRRCRARRAGRVARVDLGQRRAGLVARLDLGQSARFGGDCERAVLVELRANFLDV